MADGASMSPPKSSSPSQALSITPTTASHATTIVETGDVKHQPYGPADTTTTLCDTCSQLGLSVEKFVIANDPPTSTYGSNKSSTPEVRENGSTASIRRSGGRPLRLGSLQDIRNRQHNCVLCNLVAQSVQQRDLNKALEQHGQELLETAQGELSWEIDGREYLDTATGLIKNRTRRLRVQWTHPALQQYGSYLVFVAPEQPWRPNSEAQAASRREVHFLGRTIDPHKGRTALIKSWLDLCRYHHGDHCQDKYEGVAEFEKMLGESYFGVLDVVNMQLCVLPHVRDGPHFAHEPYVALSYVWGQPKPGEPMPYVTIRENILLHQNHGGLQGAYAQFPKAIQEAIDLVPRLGMRYIWIDSLCIVQDSFRSWNLNARRMHMIYGFASLTICAADGKDSSTGLEAMYTESADQLQGECAPGVTLMISRTPEAAIRGSRWNQRAWTFQERLLSRRCLIYAEKRMYFQCRSASMSQDIYAHGHGTAWSLDSIHAPLQMLKELRVRAIWFYIHCVSMYTCRELTKARDILAAFNGVTTLIQKVMRAPFVFGLPSSHFDLALLWQAKGAIRPRVTQEESDKAFEVEFPSWAWCGWSGAQVDYESDLLNDCLANVHEWLVNHTWICYYIRDDHGNLRPLWDKFRAEDDQSSEARWRGYRAMHLKTDRTRFRTVRVERSRERRRSPPEVGTPRRPEGSPIEAAMITEKRQRMSLVQPRGVYDDEHLFRKGERLAERLKEHHRVSRGGDTLATELSQLRESNEYAAGGRKSSFPSTPRPRPPEDPFYPDRRRRLPVRSRRQVRRSSSSSVSTERETFSTSHPYPREPVNRDEFSPVEDSAEVIYEETRRDDGAVLNTIDYGHNDRPTLPIPLDGHDSGPQEQRRRRYQVNQDYKELPSEQFDIFGRAFWDEIRLRSQNEFFRTIPENPFRVLKAAEGYDGDGDREQSYQPKLQFWTWQTTLHVCRSETRTRLEGTGLCRCDIMDSLGDWCGSIVVNESWIEEECASQGNHPDVGVVACDFVALSEAKSFTEEECPTWTYYIPKERHESEWDVFYVLLVKYHTKSAVWQRVALGKAFRAAFSFGEDGWQEIILG